MEPASSFKVRITKNYSPNDEEKYWDWIRSVDATISLLRSRPRDASTYRVPSKLRAIKPQAYTPQMVSIGPFHQQNPELRVMEELKWRYMFAFVDRVVESDMENIKIKEFSSELIEKSPQILVLDKCSKVISEQEEVARAWCKLMISIQKSWNEISLQEQIPFESVAGNFTMVQTLTHDLMLLENQIPYVILQKLFDLIPSSEMSLQEYVFWFFNSVPMLHYKDGTYSHLLDMLYHVCNLTSEKLPTNYSQSNWGFTRCAKELFQSGVQIICGHSRTIVDMKFNEGELSIPQIIIDNSSDTVFRNLIAFEQTSIGRHAITSYVKLMSTLIGSREDAYLLERVGIIIKSDEVEDVPAFFKSLCREIIFVEFCFSDLCKEVENYQMPLWRWTRVRGYFRIKFIEWKESIKDLKMHYFQSRWSFIGFLAASLAIILTLVQTFYTIRAYYPPYH